MQIHIYIEAHIYMEAYMQYKHEYFITQDL